MQKMKLLAAVSSHHIFTGWTKSKIWDHEASPQSPERPVTAISGRRPCPGIKLMNHQLPIILRTEDASSIRNLYVIKENGNGVLVNTISMG